MNQKLSPSAQRVQEALNRVGIDFEVLELPQSTRTAKDAAAALGCRESQIVKSLVFRAKSSGQAVLVLASGSNRVDEAKVSQALGEPIEKADADFVREMTGFAIGGVAPLGHTQPLLSFVDADLLQFDELWAAAGTPNAVFKLRGADLDKICKAKTLAIS